MKMRILWSVLLPISLLAAPFLANAATHAAGTNVLNNGTIYMVTTDGQLRPYTSSGAFLSYGFNSWSNVVQANSDDLALPVGAFIPPRDGKIVCSNKGDDKGTCYSITDGQKAAFTSAAVFTGLGYSFSNSLSGDVSFLSSAPNISSANQAHLPGTLVNENGTIYLVGDNGLLGVPNMSTLNSWGYASSDVTPANTADSLTAQSGVMAVHTPAALSPLGNTSLSSGTNTNTPTSPTPIPSDTPSNMPVFDACKNIPEVQPTVPAGMTGDGQGNCYLVNNIPNTPVTPTPTPIIAPAPTPATLSSTPGSDVANKATNIENQITVYLQTLNAQITALQQQYNAELIAQSIQNSLAQKSAGGCAGTITSNGCVNNQPQISINLGLSVTSNEIDQLSERKNRLNIIYNEVQNYGISGVLPPADDISFLASYPMGISW